MARVIQIKAIFQFIIPLIISAGLCYILYSDMDWADIKAGLATCRWEWIALWAAVNIAAMLFRGLRWRMQLRAIGITAPVRVMFWAIIGTYAVNLVFPRLGEVWRCGYVARRQQAGFTRVFGSMLADRLADTLSVLAITAATVIVARGPMIKFIGETGITDKLGTLLGSPWAIGIYLIIAVAIATIFIFSSVSIVARIRGIMARAWEGFASIFHMRRTWLWLLLTAGVWGGYYAGTLFTFHAFVSTADLLTETGPMAVLVTFVFGSWAMAVPSNGGIGPWQMAVMLALCGIYGMQQTPALTFATIVLALQTLLNILLGLYAFIRIALDRQP
ncbi:MAG: flippase-like domain-containing protein [Muribaculaceae bacterium]|nr:flippase-like domain-containing protein [Muribaculaceae bacterium]